MAKNKKKAQKHNSVFRVANNKSMKAKNKAKKVKTNLKKINTPNNEKVSTVNKAFTAIQKDVIQPKEGYSKAKINLVSKPAPEAPADIEKTADLFSQL